MRLNNLAAVIRAAGLPVVEVPGWLGRGAELTRVSGIVLHHTAGPRTGDYPSLATVRDGRPGIPGPLSQIGLGRERVYVIAGGRANHAGVGSWPGITGNSDTIGIEAESVGLGNDWTRFQIDAYPRLARALAVAYGVPAQRVIAHREWAPTRKVDPAGIDLREIRRFVAADEDDMFNEADRNGLVAITQKIDGYGTRIEQIQAQLSEVAAKQVGYGGRIEHTQNLAQETRDRVLGVVPETLGQLVSAIWNVSADIVGVDVVHPISGAAQRVNPLTALGRAASSVADTGKAILAGKVVTR